VRSSLRAILEQTRQNGNDIAAIRVQLGRIEQRVERTESEVRSLRSEFGQLRDEFGALRKELPVIVAETMREVLRERG
jgi:predicted RNase H-like nuclease (RuvC/YqgF family)